MTKTNAQIFTELTEKDKNDVWHEVEMVDFGAYLIQRCSCGQPLSKKCSNPTYQNAADILTRMREFCGEERFYNFMHEVGIIIGAAILNKQDHEYYIDVDYLIEKDENGELVLLQRAIDFIRSGK